MTWNISPKKRFVVILPNAIYEELIDYYLSVGFWNMMLKWYFPKESMPEKQITDVDSIFSRYSRLVVDGVPCGSAYDHGQ